MTEKKEGEEKKVASIYEAANNVKDKFTDVDVNGKKITEKYLDYLNQAIQRDWVKVNDMENEDDKFREYICEKLVCLCLAPVDFYDFPKDTKNLEQYLGMMRFSYIKYSGEKEIKEIRKATNGNTSKYI